MLYFICVTFFVVAIVIAYFSLMNYSADRQMEQSFESLKSGMDFRLNQIMNNFDASAKEAAYSTDGQNVLFTDDPFEYLSVTAPATEMTNFVMESNPNIAGIYIVSKRNRILYTDNGHDALFKKVLQDYHIDQNMNIRRPTFTKVYYEGTGNTMIPYFLYLMPVYDTRNGEFSKDPGAVCAVLCDVHTLAQDLEIDTSGKTIVAVQYQKNVISSNRLVTPKEKDVFEKLQIGQQVVLLNNKRCLASSIRMEASGWQFSYVMEDNAELAATKRIWDISLAVLFIMILIMMLGTFQISMMIIKPAKKISDEMRDVRKGWKKRISIPRVLEFRDMVESINYTLECIERANDKEKDTQMRLYESVIAQKNAELLAWRSQISPHFFFNTLECMRSMASHSGVESLEEVIGSLSKIFRYSLDAGNVAALKDELGNARSYFNIMNYRFPGRFKLRTRISPEAFQYTMPAMILQPLVENCIKHGYQNNKKNPQIIFIQGSIIEQKGGKGLFLRVTDNGSGITAKRFEEILKKLNETCDREDNTGKSIGLKNIDNRLKIIYGQENLLNIRTIAGYYTAVEITIPHTKDNDVSSRLANYNDLR